MAASFRHRLPGLIRAQRWAALATVGDAGPLASMVAYAPEPDLSALLLHLSRLAAHTGNLLEKPVASLVIGEPDSGAGDPQELERLTVSGSVSEVSRHHPRYTRLRDCYLRRLPAAEPLFGFGDFMLFRLVPQQVRYVGGFAQAYTLDGAELSKLVSTVEGGEA